MTRHVHYDYIVAWAEGKQIQIWNNEKWVDTCDPRWYTYLKYRVKPDPVVLQYRNALHNFDGKYIVITWDKTDDMTSHKPAPTFVRWLDGIQTVRIED